MLSLTVLLHLLKATATAISTLKSAGAVKDWLTRDKRDPLRRALDQTISKYEGTYANIGPQLVSVLATPKFEAQLQQLTEVGASNFSEISTRLAEAADFYDPEGGSFAEVLQTFVEAFDEALLLGPDGLAHHDRRQTALVQHVSAKVSGVSDQLDAMRGLLGPERVRSLVERTKRRAEGRAYTEARNMWSLAEEEAAASGDVESAFQVHSEIGNLAWAHHQLEEAAKHFTAAYELNPSHPRASGRLALAKMIRRDRDGALRAVKAEPDETRRLRFEALIHQWFGQNEAVVDLLRPAVEQTADTDTLSIFANAAVQLGDVDAAERAARRLLDLQPTDPGAIATFGIVLATRAERKAREDWGEAQQIWNTADEVLARAAASAQGVQRADILVRRGIVLMALGRSAASRELLEETLKLDPKSRPGRLTLARMLVEGNEDAGAVVAPLLESRDEDAAVLLLNSAAIVGTTAAADAAMALVTKHWPQTALPVMVWVATVELLTASGALSEARALFEHAPAVKPSERRLLEARIALRGGRQEEARDALRAAVADLGMDDVLIAHELARVALGLSEYSVAAEALQKVQVTARSPDAVLRPYCVALLKTDGGAEKISALINSVPLANAPRVLVEAALQVAQRRHDVRRCVELWKALLERFPNDPEVRVGLAVAAVWNGDTALATEVLAGVRAPDLERDDCFRVAEVWRRLGNHAQATAWAFGAWKQAPQDPAVCMAYLGITLRAPTAEVAQRDVVTPEHVIALELDGRDSQFVVLADDEVIPPSCGVPRFETNSDLAARLIGRRLGDSVKWSDTPTGERRAVVKEVLSPETFAFRYSMDIAARTADRAPVTKIEVGENPLESMAPILRRQREEQDKVVEEVLGKSVPMAMIARLLHKSVFDVWRQLTKGGDPGIVSNSNSAQEQQLDRAVSRGLTKAVIEPIATLTLAEAGLLDRLAGVIHLVVPQAAIDLFVEMRDDLRPHLESGRMHASFAEGRPIVQLVPAAEIRYDYDLVERIISLLRNCEVAGLHREPTERETQIAPALGDAFLHTLVLGEQWPLVCDDLHLRMLAHELGRTKTTSTWGLLSSLEGARVVSIREFTAHTTRMLRLNYRTIPVSGAILTEAIEQRVSISEYALLVEAMFRPSTNVETIEPVLAAHIGRPAFRISSGNAYEDTWRCSW